MPGCYDQNEPAETSTHIRVRTEPAKTAGMFHNTYIGTVEASVAVPLSFQVTGTVERVMASEGERVSRGQLLASLDDRSYRDALAIAEAKAKQAEDAWQRLSTLYEKGSLPEIKYIEVETGLSQAKSTRNMAQKNLADCQLISPADGVIGKRSIEPGENTIPYQSVFTLMNTSQLDVKVSVPEKEISAIKAGDEARITVPSMGDRELRGIVTRKGIVAQPISHTYDVIIRILTHEPQLLPGMVCRVDFHGENTIHLALVPVQVIQTDGNGIRFILVPDETNTRVNRKNVTTGELRGLQVVVTDGLKPGEFYISEGYQHLDTTTTIVIIR
jgi:membrane fusion protein, multidrug efflux system